MTRLSLLASAAVALALTLGNSAQADKAFSDEFIAKYVKADSTEAKDVAFKEAVEKAKCNVCHEGKSKKNRNAYGQALGKFLSRETDKENKEKIQQSLDKVAAVKSGGADSPTFGDLIKQGKLPSEKANQAAP